MQLATGAAQPPGRLLGLPVEFGGELGECLVDVDEPTGHPCLQCLDGSGDVLGAFGFGEVVHEGQPSKGKALQCRNGMCGVITTSGQGVRRGSASC